MNDHANVAARSGPYAIYRILDMTSLRCAIGPRMLADLGADVIHIEPPQGDPLRYTAPFAADLVDPERSLPFLWRNLGKRGITIDLAHLEGQALLERLIASADVLYDDFAPGHRGAMGLDWSRLHALNPRLIHVSVTEYGEDGPYAQWKGSAITAFAMSGAMQVAGSADSPPCDAPHPMAYDAAAMYANVAVSMALWARHTTGEGQRIDVSVQDAAIGGLLPWAVPTFSFAGRKTTAVTRRGKLSGTFSYACRDGWVRMPIISDRHWQALLNTLGQPDALLKPEFQAQRFRIANADLIHSLITEQTIQRNALEFIAAAQANGVPIAPVRPPSGFMHDANTRARGFWREVAHPVAGPARYPSTPIRMSVSQLPFGRPAPLLGEHNNEVYAELGLSSAEILHLRSIGAI